MSPTLQQVKIAELEKYGVEELYHLTSIKNLAGILRDGILPQNVLRNNNCEFVDIANQGVQARRAQKALTHENGVSLKIHDLVPLFFRTHTPMLFAIRARQAELCFVCIEPSDMCADDLVCILSDGNAASDATRFFLFGESIEGAAKAIGELPWSEINARYWRDHDDGGRRCSAEFLVSPSIRPSAFRRILVQSASACLTVSTIAENSSVGCEVSPRSFFLDD